MQGHARLDLARAYTGSPGNALFSDSGFEIGAGEIVRIEFCHGKLTDSEQAVISEGFRLHSEELGAPEYVKERFKWLGFDDHNDVKAVLTADIVWDWMYVDELWVSPTLRGAGMGRQLMQLAEEFAVSREISGIWLWTQSWQAEGFYRHLGYSQFTHFDNFPKDHSRIGFRKQLTSPTNPESDGTLVP